MLGNVPSLLLSSLRTLCPGDNFCNSLNKKLEKTERMMEIQAPVKFERVCLKQTP